MKRAVINPPPSGAELKARVHAARTKVRTRPDHGAVKPTKPFQESVWRYPRPPRVETVAAEVRALVSGREIARTAEALRVLETSGPPTVYIPEVAFSGVAIVENDAWALCEWKGLSRYVDLISAGTRIEKAGWHFLDPFDDLQEGYRRLVGHIALFPRKVECWIGGERALPQEGSYYGGWITSTVAGPFKGAPGTEDW